jgi:hypothetical protein
MRRRRETRMSAYEQFKQQQALARLQRAHHGADTMLDDAFVRLERDSELLNFARKAVPPVAMFGVASIDVRKPEAIALSMALFFIGWAAGGVIGSIIDWWDINGTRGRSFHEWCYRIAAIPMYLSGLGTLSIGATVAGTLVIAWPSIWKRWSAKLVRDSDYVRLRNAANAPPATPRITE